MMGKHSCRVCGEKCVPHMHRIQEKDLNLLRDQHCVDEKLRIRMEVSHPVCCRHFEVHDHGCKGRNKLTVKSDWCTLSFLGTQQDLILPSTATVEDSKEDRKWKRKCIDTVLLAEKARNGAVCIHAMHADTSHPLYDMKTD